MEELRVIAGKEGYRVSCRGRVYSDKSGKWLTNQLSDDGYNKVVLRLNGKAYNFRVHRLVAEAFLESPEQEVIDECSGYMYSHGKVLVRHIDNNKLNNTVENLMWGTPIDNAADYLAFKAAGNIAERYVRTRKHWKQLPLDFAPFP